MPSWAEIHAPKALRRNVAYELAADWRRRANMLDAQARTARTEGDTVHATDLETAAVDYVAAAEQLELEAQS